MFTEPLTNRRRFIVGNKIFGNNISALQHFTKHPNDPMCFDPGYHFTRNPDIWQKEPPQDIDFYLRLHARHIADHYDEIFLMYSGGTDSHTMLKAFVDEEIKNIKLVSVCNGVIELNKNHVIHELFSKYNGKLESLNYKIAALSYGQKEGSSSIKTYYNIMSEGKFGDFELNIRTPFSWIDVLSERSPSLKKEKKSSKACILMGIEKPRLTLLNSNTWAWEMLSVFSPDVYFKTEDDNIDQINFYLSDQIPEIQIKLSWLKKDILEKIMFLNNLPMNSETIEKIQSNTGEFYTIINAYMGYTALNDYLFSNRTKKELKFLTDLPDLPQNLLLKNPSSLVYRKDIIEKERKQNQINELIHEFTQSEFSKIRSDLFTDEGKVPAIKSIPIPFCKLSKKMP